MLFRRKKESDPPVNGAQPAGGGGDHAGLPGLAGSLFGRKTAVMTSLPVNFGLDGPSAQTATQTAHPPVQSPLIPTNPLLEPNLTLPAPGTAPEAPILPASQYNQPGQAPDGQSAPLISPIVPEPILSEPQSFVAHPAGHTQEELHPFAASQLQSAAAQEPLVEPPAFEPMAQQGLSSPSGQQGLSTPLGQQGLSTPLGQQGLSTPLGQQGLSTPAGQRAESGIPSWATVGQPLPLHGTLSDDDLPVTPALPQNHNLMAHPPARPIELGRVTPSMEPSAFGWGEPATPAAHDFSPPGQISPALVSPSLGTSPAFEEPSADFQTEASHFEPSQPAGAPTGVTPQPSGYGQDDFYALDAPNFEMTSQAISSTVLPLDNGWATDPVSLTPGFEAPATFELLPSYEQPDQTAVYPSSPSGAFQESWTTTDAHTLWIDEDGEAILSLDDGMSDASNPSLIEPSLPAPLSPQEQALLAELERQQSTTIDELDGLDPDVVLHEAQQLLEEPSDYLSWQAQHPQVQLPPIDESDDLGDTGTFTLLHASDALVSSQALAPSSPVNERFDTLFQRVDEEETDTTFSLDEPGSLEEPRFSQPASPLAEAFAVPTTQPPLPVFNGLGVPSSVLESSQPTVTHETLASTQDWLAQSPTPVQVPVQEPVQTPSFQQPEPQAIPSAFAAAPELDFPESGSYNPSSPLADVAQASGFSAPTATAPRLVPEEPSTNQTVGPEPEPELAPAQASQPWSATSTAAPSNVTTLNPSPAVITINDFALEGIRVVLTHELSAQHRLYVAQVSGRTVLIGQTAGRIELLQFIDLPEISKQTLFVVAEAATSLSRRLLFVQVGNWQGHILVDNSGMLMQSTAT